MEFMAPFDNLPLDEWFKPLVLLGALVTISALFAPPQIQDLNRLHVLLLSVGTFLYGLGEWQNHHYIQPLGGSRGKGMLVRQKTPLGETFRGIGALIIILGILAIIKGIFTS
jgi:hypothetical protein